MRRIAIGIAVLALAAFGCGDSGEAPGVSAPGEALEEAAEAVEAMEEAAEEIMEEEEAMEAMEEAAEEAESVAEEAMEEQP